MESLHTLQGQFLGTPEFMSPEQAAGAFDEVDTRTDVYALGSLLYQLLTDVLPVPRRLLRGKSKSWRDIEQVVREHAIVPPSQAVPDKRRERLLRGDLDWVVTQALAKNPDERYGTVAEMRDDIQRYLDGEPVEVGPPSRLYALRKFARRNRVQFLAAAVVFVGLAAALAVALMALSHAREQTRRAEEIRGVADAKADAGFKLLANLTALQEARAETDALLPAWPQHREALSRWLANYGDKLPQELEKMRAKLTEIDARRPARHQPSRPAFATRNDRYLYGTLQRCIDEFEAFVANDGLLSDMRLRERWATFLTDHAAADAGKAWEQAIATIKTSSLYDNRRIAPQAGLHPLGPDPVSGHMEFVHLRSGAKDRAIPRRDPTTGRLTLAPHHGIVFVLIPGGDFWMGSRPTDPGLPGHDPWSSQEERPSKKELVGAFFLAKHEMHRAQWERLAHRAGPSADIRLADMNPMTQVRGNAAQEILIRHGLTLPTEAQWEYACRGKTRDPWWTGETEETLRGKALYDVPITAAPFQFARVDSLQANAFGLHHMHGNGAEWTHSPFVPYDQDANEAFESPDAVELWTIRGGSAFDSAQQCRSASRRGLAPDAASTSVGVRPMRAILND